MPSLFDSMEFAKSQKSHQIDSMPPHIIVEKDDQVVAVVVSPVMDKTLALQAAFLCNLGFKPDNLTVTFDANVREDEDDDLPEQHHCLVSQRIDQQGAVEMMVLPYKHFDGYLVWQDKKRIVTDDSEGKIEGKIASALRKIMSNKAIVEHEDFKQMIAKFTTIPMESPEKVLFHTSRAVMAILISMKFKVIDLLSQKHPDWTDAVEKGKHIVKTIIEEGVINNTNVDKLNEVVEKHLGKPTFSEIFEHYIEMSEYKSMEGLTVSQFVKSFESMCMSPFNPNDFNHEESDDS